MRLTNEFSTVCTDVLPRALQCHGGGKNVDFFHSVFLIEMEILLSESLKHMNSQVLFLM